MNTGKTFPEIPIDKSQFDDVSFRPPTKAELAQKAVEEMREKNPDLRFPRRHRRQILKITNAWNKVLENLVMEYVTKTTVEGVDPESKEGLTVLDHLDWKWRNTIKPEVSRISRKNLGIYDTPDKRERIFGKFLEIVGSYHEKVSQGKTIKELNEKEVVFEEVKSKPKRSKKKKEVIETKDIPTKNTGAPNTQTVAVLIESKMPLNYNKLEGIFKRQGINSKAKTVRGITNFILRQKDGVQRVILSDIEELL